MAAPAVPETPIRRPIGYHKHTGPLLAEPEGTPSGLVHLYHLGVTPFDGFMFSLAEFTDEAMQPDAHQVVFDLLVAGRSYSMTLHGKDAARKLLTEAEFYLFTTANSREFLFAQKSTVENVRKSQTLITKQLAEMTEDEKEQRKLQELVTRQQQGLSKTKYIPKGEFMDTDVIAEISLQHIQNMLQPPGDVKIAYRTRVPADPSLSKEHSVEFARTRVYKMINDILETHYQ